MKNSIQLITSLFLFYSSFVIAQEESTATLIEVNYTSPEQSNWTEISRAVHQISNDLLTIHTTYYKTGISGAWSETVSYLREKYGPKLKYNKIESFFSRGVAGLQKSTSVFQYDDKERILQELCLLKTGDFQEDTILIKKYEYNSTGYLLRTFAKDRTLMDSVVVILNGTGDIV